MSSDTKKYDVELPGGEKIPVMLPLSATIEELLKKIKIVTIELNLLTQDNANKLKRVFVRQRTSDNSMAPVFKFFFLEI